MEEMLNSGSSLQLAGVQELTPFPDHQPHLIAAPGPQKLRPIRSNGLVVHKLDNAELLLQANISPPNYSATASSSSDCSDKPRKKRKKKEMESFLQHLMSQVLYKQEQMHQQLMDMFLNNENQRVLREQAWRQQEMERVERDHQIRAQEAARSLALISFIRNVLGVPDITS